MKFKKTGIITTLGILILLSLFVWPTMYRYDKLQYSNGESLLKINRITGDIYELKNSKWHYIKKP